MSDSKVPLSARLVCQFSCGAASAVATKLVLAEFGATHDVQIVNAFVAEEHEDNRRFLTDCEAWFGRPITVMRDIKYNASTLEVFAKRGYMKGLRGAPCSTYLKRKVLDGFNRKGDVAVFGFTVEEADRFVDFKAHNPKMQCLAPLISRGLGKQDCLAMVERAGLVLPLMYRMGYHNANCIGCVKGGEGYMRAIKADFPVHFEALAKVQDAIGPGAYLYRNRTTNERYSLRDIPDGEPRRNEEIPSCSFFCEISEKEYADAAV